MNRLEMQNQFQALQKFQESIGRDFRDLRWPYRRKMREPVEHMQWRRAASSARRFSLFYGAGLVAADEQDFYDGLFRAADQRARAAWAAWMRRKEQIEMSFLSGRRKTLPWSC